MAELWFGATTLSKSDIFVDEDWWRWKEALPNLKKRNYINLLVEFKCERRIHGESGLFIGKN